MALIQSYLDENKTLIKTVSDSGFYIQSNTGDFYGEAVDMACFILNGERYYTESKIKMPVTRVTVDEITGERRVEDVDSQEILAASMSLENIKQLKINSLKSMRDAEETLPVEFAGHLWDCDDMAQKRISCAIIALGDEGTITWTSADNEEIEGVTADTLRGVIGAAAARSNALHVKYRSLRETVESCLTAEEIESVNW